MKKWFKGMTFSLAAVAVLAGCSTEAPGSGGDDGDGGAEDGEGSEEVSIGMSISTLNNPFFVSLSEGAEEAAEEAGAEITVSDAQDDSATQVSDIEDLIQQEVDVLLVNPTDSAAVASAVESANSSDIPVITVDRSAEGGEVVSHIASDNVAGGEMAGQFIVDALEGEGNVVELEGIAGSSAANERGKGFHNIVDEEDGIEIVANQTADFDRSEGLTVMENIIQSNEDIDALFAHNDEMALGAFEAIEAASLEDVIVVGFDATDGAVAAVEEGRMAATIAQQPVLIGEEAIDAAMSVANGEDIDESIPVELELVEE